MQYIYIYICSIYIYVYIQCELTLAKSLALGMPVLSPLYIAKHLYIGLYIGLRNSFNAKHAS